jgi:tetratricopeptide (TPR) repeat protein
MKKLVLLLLTLSTGFSSSFAQKGVEDGSRFGHGEDSIRCIQNISIYAEYVKTKNYVDAYKPWKSVFTEAPRAQASLYTKGATIVSHLFKKEKDPVKKKAYFEELMKIYDQRIQYLDDLNKLIKRPVTKGSILGMKGYKYVLYAGKSLNLKTAYDILKEAVDLEKSKSKYYVLQAFVKVSSFILKKDETHKTQFIEDYLAASEYAEQGLTAAKNEKIKGQLKTTKDNINAFFIKSGAANCDNLEEIYASKVEANKENIDFLKGVVTVMKKLGCTENNSYFKAAEYAHKINPTAETAIGVAYMMSKQKDFKTAYKYFQDALSLEKDSLKKADYAYTAGVIMSTNKDYSKARNFARIAIANNPNYGAAYILIAQLYAGNSKWNSEAALNSCTFCLVLDKLAKAKAVDPSVADEARKLINRYSAYLPKKADLFFLNLKVGDRVTIGGWIGESTTIRTRD